MRRDGVNVAVRVHARDYTRVSAECSAASGQFAGSNVTGLRRLIGAQRSPVGNVSPRIGPFCGERWPWLTVAPNDYRLRARFLRYVVNELVALVTIGGKSSFRLP